MVPAGIFRMFPVAAGRAGATFVEVPTKAGYVPDIDALLRRIGPTTKLVALANPNNPTGSYASRADLDRLFAGLPGHVVAVIDEAYFEFARETADYPDSLDYLRAGHNVAILRTFSKVYGLAGLRIGYAFAAPDIAAAMNKVREPFNTTTVAQAAAIAALEDEDHRDKTLALVREERAFLARELGKRGASVNPSLGNFLLVELPIPFGPIEPDFARRGVILRPMGGWGFPLAFRLSVGRHDENLRFLAVFDELLDSGLLGLVAGPPPPPDDRRRHRRAVRSGEVDRRQGACCRPRRPLPRHRGDVPGHRTPRESGKGFRSRSRMRTRSGSSRKPPRSA